MTKISKIKIFCLFLILLSFLAVCGCDDPKYEMRPHYDNWIRIDGLGNYTTESGSANFMVPVPMYNGTPVLPFPGIAEDDIIHSMGWDTEYVSLNARGYYGFYHGTDAIFLNDTKYGKLMNISVDQTDYFKVDRSGDPGLAALINNTSTADSQGFFTYPKGNFSFDRVTVYLRDMIGLIGDARTNATVDALINKPLYPDAGDAECKYTVHVNNSTANYTTYIYIDEGLKPIKPGNNSIEVCVIFEIIVGYHPYGNVGSHYFYVIKESIPEGVTGSIPVKVQYIASGDYYETQKVYDLMPYR